MKRSKFTMLLIAALVATFLIIPLSAFTFASNATRPQEQPLISRPGHKILPGQELVFPHPLKKDPGAMLHLKMSRIVVAPFMSCQNNIWEQEWITNVYGGTLASYKITINFCYDGTHVTSITTPPHESWSTCCFWSLSSHHAYSEIDMDQTFGIAHGSFTFNGPLNSWSSWVEIDVYNDGSWYGFGG